MCVGGGETGEEDAREVCAGGGEGGYLGRRGVIMGCEMKGKSSERIKLKSSYS